MKIFINSLSIDQRITDYIGLAIKAGKIVIGEKLMEKIHHNKIALIIRAKDANKSFIDSIPDNINVVVYLNQIELAKLINRFGSKINGFGVMDKNFAELLIKRFNAMKGEFNEK